LIVRRRAESSRSTVRGLRLLFGFFSTFASAPVRRVERGRSPGAALAAARRFGGLLLCFLALALLLSRSSFACSRPAAAGASLFLAQPICF